MTTGDLPHLVSRRLAQAAETLQAAGEFLIEADRVWHIIEKGGLNNADQSDQPSEQGDR